MISDQNLSSLRLALIKQKRIAITGASGWLGRETSELIARSLGSDSKDRLVLVSSTPRKIKINNKEFQTIGWDEFISMRRIDMLFHFAFLTQEKAKIIGAKKFISVNRKITSDVSRVLERNPDCDVFNASSGAVEHYVPDIESANSMQLYAALKREAEEIFYQNREIVTLQNMRIWNVTGQCMSLESPFVVAQFFKQALRKGVISINGNSMSSRTFADVQEMMLVSILTQKLGQRRTLSSGGFKSDLAGLAIEIAKVVGVSSDSIVYEGETSIASHYNPESLAFNELAVACDVSLSGISEQIKSLYTAFSGLSLR